MVRLFWFDVQLPAQLQFLGNKHISFLVHLLAWGMIAFVVRFLLFRTAKWLTRKTETEVDDVILRVSRVPLLLVIVIFGVVKSLAILELGRILLYLEKALYALLIAVITYWVWRLFKDVIIYCGEEYAERTETNVDDVLIPVVNQLCPIVIFILGGAIILQYLGVDLSALLVAIGGGAFIAAFALQDTLSNVFGGISLLVDTPFKYGDLIVLEDGRVCVIEKIGLRVTQLYNIEDHSIIFMPNSQLANERLENITRPTAARKSVIRVSVGYDSDVQQVFDILDKAAHCHPHVFGNINAKLQALRKCQIEPREKRIGEFLEKKEGKGNSVQALLKEILRLEKEVKRLEEEDKLNTIIENLTDELEKLADRIDALEEGGLDEKEKGEIGADIDRIEQRISEIERSMTVWMMLRRYTMVRSKDDFDTPTQVRGRAQEYADKAVKGIDEGHITMLGMIPIGRKEELEVSRQLETIVHRRGFASLDKGFSDIDMREEFISTIRQWNKKAWLLDDKLREIRRELESGNEQRLDDRVREFRDWVYTGLKETTPEWKYPQVKLVEYGKSGLDFALDFYVDNIMLDHYERQGNVEADLRREILERFREAGIEMPLPQVDIHFRRQMPFVNKD